MAEKPKFDYSQDTGFGKFLEYGDFLGEDSIYNPYNLGTALYDLGAVPINKASEFFTGYNPGLSGNRFFNRGDPNIAYFLGAETDATPGYLSYEERMQLARDNAEREADIFQKRQDQMQKGKFEKNNPKPKFDTNIDNFIINQENAMDKFRDPDYKPADPFQVAGEKSFNPARLEMGNMKLDQAIFEDKMEKGLRELSDISKKKMDEKDLKDKEAAAKLAKQEAYESKSFLEKMFDKDVREGESISNADKTFASMNAISRRLLEPRNPGEYRSFLGDIALGLDDAGQTIKALETEAEDRATDAAAANLEALFKQAQINEATARTSKTMADEQKVYADMNLDQAKEYRAGLTDAAKIAVDLRQASLLDPSKDQPSDLLTNDAKNAMIVVQGETGLKPGDAGYAAAVAAELIKGYSLDQQKAMLEALSFEYISMVEDPSLQQQLTDIKNSLVMNMAGAMGSGVSDNEVSYNEQVLGKE